MNKEIIIDRYGAGHAAAVLEDGKVIDCFIDPPQKSDFYPPNTFLKAFIDRKLPNMGGYFVKLPNGSQGFLKSKNRYSEGNTVSLLSQVIYETHKPQIFTDVLKVVSKYFIISIGKSGYSFSKKLPSDFDMSNRSNILSSKISRFDDIFIICRSSIAKLTLGEFDKEVTKVIDHTQKIQKKLALNHLCFDGLARKVITEMYRTKFFNVIEQEGVFERLGIWDQLEELKNGIIHLENGSYLIFEQTSAFLTIDINSGRDFKATKEDINLSACSEIFRIIKVCGFGGKILIDFLPCSQTVKKKILRKVLSSLNKDLAKSKIWGWTKSGIFELERQRDKIPLKLLM